MFILPVFMQRADAHLDVVVAVQSEPVVDALWEHNHVPLSAVYSDPPVVKVPHIKVPCTDHSPLT